LTPAPLGIYVHWPYCARICPYCDFNVVRDRGRVAEQRALRGAILADLTAHAVLTGPRALVSIFLGGGTPSLMDPGWAAEIIETARGLWAPTSDLEVTLEANPTDAETARFAAFAEAGVNRLSLGVQSLDDAELKFLGRNHDAASARHAARRALAAFPRVSLDLIYALPGQGVAAWSDRLRAAIDLGAEHISPYQLTIEAGTAFDRSVRRGTLTAAGPDLAADLYETTQGVLEAAGFEAYEVSNHARGETARSRHNLIYWRGHDYVGVGPGAHGRLTLAAGRFATEAPREIAGYVGAAGEAGTRLERLSAPDIATERLLMGLRTVEGVALDDLAALVIGPERLSRLGGLVSVQGSRLRVTRRGRPVLDRIVAQLAGNA